MYRQFARIVALFCIAFFSLYVLYALIGENAAPPNGKLYQLILLSSSAHLGGWLISPTTLPKSVGMTAVGLIFPNTNIVNIDDTFKGITNELSQVALVVILIRAGLDLDPPALRRLKYTVLKLSLIPWTVEAVTVATLSKYFLRIPWMYAVLLGTIVAAVAPAVVVPCLFRLRSKGYGVAKGIPTLIIAVASIGDSTSVAIFGVVKSIMFSDTSLTNVIIQGPLSVIGGYGGAGPLGCVTASFIALSYWTQAGWKIDDNPATTAFEIFWRIFQPILFSIAGARIKLNELDGTVVLTGCMIVIIGVVTRMLVTTLVGIGCKLNLKEKVFVAIAWMCKAIVQAALGPVALSMVAPGTDEYRHAEKVLTTCVLSIIITVPTGALLTTLLGPRFLTKTKHQLVMPETKRKYSRRPSIRDITIIDEDDEEVEEEIKLNRPERRSEDTTDAQTFS